MDVLLLLLLNTDNILYLMTVLNEQGGMLSPVWL